MEQNEAAEQKNQTNKQLAALPYFVSFRSLSKAARLANVGRTTIYRWMHDDSFRD